MKLKATLAALLAASVLAMSGTAFADENACAAGNIAPQGANCTTSPQGNWGGGY